MAMAFTFQVLENSVRNYVLQVSGIDTATTTAWTQNGSSTGIIAANGYTPTIHMKLWRIVYNTTGCMARLQWHQTTNAELISVSGFGDYNLAETQGIFNPNGAGSTGDVDLSSIATSANTAGTVTAAMSLTLEMIKGV